MKASSFAFSFSKFPTRKEEKTSNLFTPGPGAYSSNDLNKLSAPKWRIGTGQRSNPFTSGKNNPGPGNYSSNIKHLSSAPNYTIRLKTTNMFDPNRLIVSPGPGNYDPTWKSVKPASASYSVRLRPKTADSKNVPGVGSYELRKMVGDFNVSAYKFGQEKKIPDLLKSKTNVPGPGRYENQGNIGKEGPRYTVGHEKRGNTNRAQTPGPGTYNSNLNNKNKAPIFSISSVRPKTSLPNNNPGPGTYTSGFTDRPTSPSYKIGNSLRGSLSVTESKIPGPGNYEPDAIRFRPKSPNWRIGTSNRSEIKTMSGNVPGPGNYNYTREFGTDGLKATFKLKLPQKERAKTPGPGSYSTESNQVNPHNPTWKIGTESRDPSAKKVKRKEGTEYNVPGVGKYELRTDIFDGRKSKFGNEKRGVQKINPTPGPGAYKLPCAVCDQIKSPYSRV